MSSVPLENGAPVDRELVSVGVDSNSGITVTTTPVVTIFTYGRDGRLTSTTSSFRIAAGANNYKVPMRCVELSASGRPSTKADTNHTDSDGCN